MRRAWSGDALRKDQLILASIILRRGGGLDSLSFDRLGKEMSSFPCEENSFIAALGSPRVSRKLPGLG
jgi:hypothetical protein